MFSSFFGNNSDNNNEGTSVNSGGAVDSCALFNFPNKPLIKIIDDVDKLKDENFVIDGIKLFTYKDIMSIKEEITNEFEYELLFEEPEDYRKMFIKVKGEGSESAIKRHKYIRKNYPCSPEEFISCLRDMKRRKVWDDRLEARNIIRIYKYIDKESGHTVINAIERLAHKGVFPVQGRDFITLSGMIRTSKHHFIHVGCSVTHRVVNKENLTSILPLEEFGPIEGFKEYIRGEHIFVAGEISGSEDTCHYCSLIETDVKGWIPSSVYNWFVKFIPKQAEENVLKGINHRRKENILPELNEYYFCIDEPAFL
ncbi:hypothetical protein ABK040_006792 [Willaertia magna]